MCPGDIILTGTLAGVGPLVPGDVVECSIEGLGTFRIRIGPKLRETALSAGRVRRLRRSGFHPSLASIGLIVSPAYRRDFLLGADFRFDVLPLFGFRVLALAVGGMIYGSNT